MYSFSLVGPSGADNLVVVAVDGFRFRCARWIDDDPFDERNVSCALFGIDGERLSRTALCTIEYFPYSPRLGLVDNRLSVAPLGPAHCGAHQVGDDRMLLLRAGIPVDLV